MNALGRLLVVVLALSRAPDQLVLAHATWEPVLLATSPESLEAVPFQQLSLVDAEQASRREGRALSVNWKRALRIRGIAAAATRKAPDVEFFLDGPEDSGDSEAQLAREKINNMFKSQHAVFDRLRGNDDAEIDTEAPAPSVPKALMSAPRPNSTGLAPPARTPLHACPFEDSAGPADEQIVYLLKTGAASAWKARLAQDTWVRAVPPGDRVLFLCDEDYPRTPSLGSVLVVPTKSSWPDCQIDGHLCSFYHLLPVKVGLGLMAALKLTAEGPGPRPGWYIVGDDDTFFMPAHVRRALKKYSPDKIVMIGQKAQAGYYGGGGWAMSRAAVDLLRATYDEYMTSARHNIARNFVYDDILIPEHIFACARKAGLAHDREDVFVDAPEFCASPPIGAEADVERMRVSVKAVPAGRRLLDKSEAQPDNRMVLQQQAGRRCDSQCPASFHLKGNQSQETQWSQSLTESQLDRSAWSTSVNGSWQLVEGWMCLDGGGGRGKAGSGWPVSLRSC